MSHHPKHPTESSPPKNSCLSTVSRSSSISEVIHNNTITVAQIPTALPPPSIDKHVLDTSAITSSHVQPPTSRSRQRRRRRARRRFRASIPVERQDDLPPTAQPYQDGGAEQGGLCVFVCRDGVVCAEEGDGHSGVGETVGPFSSSLHALEHLLLCPSTTCTISHSSNPVQMLTS